MLILLPAVEASDCAEMARMIIRANGFADRIEVIHGKLEEIELPEKVDVIVSEPIGFLLGKIKKNHVLATLRIINS